MKIIDLLNKIANGEEVPKKIKHQDDIYVHIDNYCYYCDETNLILSDRIFAEYSRLNDEIEILEEEKKIPEKLKDILRVDDLIPPVDENMHRIWKQTIKNQNKINEICDYLNSKGDE